MFMVGVRIIRERIISIVITSVEIIGVRITGVDRVVIIDGAVSPSFSTPTAASKLIRLLLVVLLSPLFLTLMSHAILCMDFMPGS